jgi:hypothetical protein
LVLIFFNPDCGYCRELAPKLAEVAAGCQPAGEGGILPPGRNAHSTGSPERLKDSAPTDAHSPGLEARLNGRQGCPPLQILILATGDAEMNRQLFAEHKVVCSVLLQPDGEVAKAYQAHGTPTGYLISDEGKIASELAMGAESLLKLAEAKSEIRNPKSKAARIVSVSAHSPAASSSAMVSKPARQPRTSSCRDWMDAAT